MGEPTGEAPAVLVVDDEPGLREVLDITLRHHGYRVVAIAARAPERATTR